MLIGYSDNRKAWRFLIDSKGLIIETDLVTFLDREFDPLPTIETTYVLLPDPGLITRSLDFMAPPVVVAAPAGEVVAPPDPPVVVPAVEPQADRNRGPRGGRRAPAVGLVPARTSSRMVSPIARFISEQRFPSGHRQIPRGNALMSKITYKDAIANPLGVSAIAAEKADLLDNKKVSIVKIPLDRTPIGTTWAFKEKSESETRNRLQCR